MACVWNFGHLPAHSYRVEPVQITLGDRSMYSRESPSNQKTFGSEFAIRQGVVIPKPGVNQWYAVLRDLMLAIQIDQTTRS